MYNKIKKRNGESFAQELRNFHNGLFEIEDLDLIVRHAGRKAAPLLPYLMGLLAAQNKAENEGEPAPAPENPFTLLGQAGYDAFYADTLGKQNSIKQYFEPGELLCTFDDAARHEHYHIVHAIKKNAAALNRNDFRGKEEREDAYGTSVISIQMLKQGGFISIKNRYNHAVAGCDHTFNSNPDNIISGLSAALRTYFNVAFTAGENPLPGNFVIQGHKIFCYHRESNNIYFGDQAWACDGVIHEVDRAAGNALFERFVFDNKSKTLKPIDPRNDDSFAEDFNRYYGGNSGLVVQNGNLVLDRKILIHAGQSRITALSLPALTTMGDNCLRYAYALKKFNAPALTTMGNHCLRGASTLIQFNAPSLTKMGNSCLSEARALKQFNAPALTAMGAYCLSQPPALTYMNIPALKTMKQFCLIGASALKQFDAPSLITMGVLCLSEASALKHINIPALTTMEDGCFSESRMLTHLNAPSLTVMGGYCFSKARALTKPNVPSLTTMGNHCLFPNNFRAIEALKPGELQNRR